MILYNIVLILIDFCDVRFKFEDKVVNLGIEMFDVFEKTMIEK